MNATYVVMAAAIYGIVIGVLLGRFLRKNDEGPEAQKREGL